MRVRRLGGHTRAWAHPREQRPSSGGLDGHRKAVWSQAAYSYDRVATGGLFQAFWIPELLTRTTHSFPNWEERNTYKLTSAKGRFSPRRSWARLKSGLGQQPCS